MFIYPLPLNKFTFFLTANEEKYLAIQPAFIWVLLNYLTNEGWYIPKQKRI